MADPSQARELHRQGRWDEACVFFASATDTLDASDWEAFAEAAQLTGRHEEAVAALERAFALRRSQADVDAAATSAYWLFQEFLWAGEMTRAGGWVARLHQLADQTGTEPGWLSVAMAYGCLGQAQHHQARELLARARAAGRNVDVQATAFLLTARAFLAEDELGEGLRALDEAMMLVLDGQTSPRVTSGLYCAAISNGEKEAGDLARAQEWARAMERWMGSLPTVIGGPFMNNCRVYRGALMRRRGQWQDARRELEAAAHELAEGHGALVIGHAYYELGEVQRLLGDFEAAEQSYRSATAKGASAHPGLALLRLDQNDVGSAASGIRRALSEAQRAPDRRKLLPAAVTVMLAADATIEARQACDELSQRAALLGGTSAVSADAARALGEVALADGEPAAALPHLRRSAAIWRQLGAPYEVATLSVLIGTACRRLGDDEGAELEFEAAREAFAALGASHDLGRVHDVLGRAANPYGLTPRELEVLRLLTAGRTNRAIAQSLFLSERTVHRHVSNVLAKLAVSSRTEAASVATRQRLI